MPKEEYIEIDRDELHTWLMNIQPGMKLLVDGEPYICDNIDLRPAINRELMVLPLRYLDGAVKVEMPDKVVLHISDSEHARPYTIEIIK